MGHIIPRFVFKWLRKTGLTHHMRFNREPNKRAQDGMKLPMMCSGCEGRISGWERRFKDEVFTPLTKGEWPERYSRESVLCALSIVWRVGQWAERAPEAESEGERLSRERTAAAMPSWCEQLRAGVVAPETVVRLIPMGVVENAAEFFTGYQNRYLARAVQIDILYQGTEGACYTWCKMGPLSIVGVVRQEEDDKGAWENTRLEPEGGKLKRRMVIPQGIWEYMAQKAKEAGNLRNELSAKQKAVVNAAGKELLRTPEKLRETGMGQAILADMRLYGFGAGLAGEEEGRVLVRTIMEWTGRKGFMLLRKKGNILGHLETATKAWGESVEAGRPGKAEAKAVVERALATYALLQEVETVGHQRITIVLAGLKEGRIHASWFGEDVEEATPKDRRVLGRNVFQVEVKLDELNSLHEHQEAFVKTMQETPEGCTAGWAELWDSKPAERDEQWINRLQGLIVETVVWWTTMAWMETLQKWSYGMPGAKAHVFRVGPKLGKTGKWEGVWKERMEAPPERKGETP